MTERERFEHWAWNVSERKLSLRKNGDDDYYEYETAVAWAAWQAALPPVKPTSTANPIQQEVRDAVARRRLGIAAYRKPDASEMLGIDANLFVADGQLLELTMLTLLPQGGPAPQTGYGNEHGQFSENRDSDDTLGGIFFPLYRLQPE